MRNVMRIAVMVIVAAGLVTATPAPANPAPPGKQSGKILVSNIDTGTLLGTGHGNWYPVDDERLRQACPKPSDFDGKFFKFFDLKADYTKFKAYGPKPVTEQVTPVGVFHDYDIDLWLMDAKCKYIEVTGGNAGGAIEKMNSRKPARYAVINYWFGPYVDLPVTLEYSN